MPSQERHSFLDWIRLKHYQFLTTFGLYMMTPRERLLFHVFFVLFISLVLIGFSVYLPERVVMIANRAWFYYAGDEAAAAKADSLADSLGAASTVGLAGRGL